MIQVLLANKWVRWGLIAVASLSMFFATVYLYGETRHKAGYTEGSLHERIQWEQKLRVAQGRIAEAESQLAVVRSERDRARAERDTVRSQIRQEAREEIANAPDTESRYAAYLRERDRLRDATAERFARSRADYLSSLGRGADGSAPGS